MAKKRHISMPNNTYKWIGHDKNSQKESEHWDDVDILRDQKVENARIILKVLWWIAPIFIMFFSALFVLSLAAWSFHHLAPPNWHWLSDLQLSKIQSVIFSGTLGAVLSSYYRNYKQDN